MRIAIGADHAGFALKQHSSAVAAGGSATRSTIAAPTARLGRLSGDLRRGRPRGRRRPRRPRHRGRRQRPGRADRRQQGARRARRALQRPLYRAPVARAQRRQRARHGRADRRARAGRRDRRALAGHRLRRRAPPAPRRPDRGDRTRSGSERAGTTNDQDQCRHRPTPSRWRTLAETDPDIAGVHPRRAAPPEHRPRADRLGELRLARR